MNVIGYTENGAIRIEIDGVELFVPDDMENRHRVMVAEWEADGNTTPQYAATHPTPEQQLAALPPVSHAQIIAVLILAGIITEAEGVAWITGTLPAAVEAMIATLPADQRVIARLRAIRPTSVIPTDPLVAALAAAQGQGVADLIVLFQTAAAL